MSSLRTWRMLLALFAALTLFAAACGDSDDDDGGDEETTETTAAAEDGGGDDGGDDDGGDAAAGGDGAFRVAFVSPSAVNDLAFSQSIFDAMTTLQESYGGESAFEFAFSDGLFVVEDAAAALRGYAEDGYDLVIAHGSQYGGSLQEIAPDFPETAFAWGPALDTFDLPNVSSYNSAADEGGFVMGVMAAQMTDNIGVVGPVEAGEPTDFINAFERGVGTDADVAITYTGSFSDVALASEAANSFISNGAEVLTGTSQAMVGAIGAAAEAGVFWFATQTNQNSLAPDYVVANQVYKWEVVLEPIIDGIQGGTLGGFIEEIDLSNGGIVMEFNDAAVVDDPEGLRTLMDETVAGIVAGEIDTEG
ncbi:MAG: BMP family protein [Actinomycetota bacterium]